MYDGDKTMTKLFGGMSDKHEVWFIIPFRRQVLHLWATFRLKVKSQSLTIYYEVTLQYIEAATDIIWCNHAALCVMMCTSLRVITFFSFNLFMRYAPDTRWITQRCTGSKPNTIRVTCISQHFLSGVCMQRHKNTQSATSCPTDMNLFLKNLKLSCLIAFLQTFSLHTVSKGASHADTLRLFVCRNLITSHLMSWD